MANWYFDAVNGNDSTGNGSIGAPFQSIAQLNYWLFQLGHAGPGDNIYFRMGAYRGEQEFNAAIGGAPVGINTTYGSGPPANLTFGTYGAGGYKPILDNMTILTGWGGSGPVYTLSLAADHVIYEDWLLLPRASSAACTDGNYFWSSGTLYYKPTSGTPSARKVQYSNDIVAYIHNCSGMTFFNLSIVGAPLFASATSPGIINFATINTDFYAGGLKVGANGIGQQVNGVTVDSCTFDHCLQNSIRLASDYGNGPTTGLTNIYITQTIITNHNTDGNGNMWDTVSDVDAIYGQNWGTVLIEHSEISGFTGNSGTTIFSNAIQDYTGFDDNGLCSISIYANNAGLIEITCASNPGSSYYPVLGLGTYEFNTGDYIWLYGATGSGAPNGRWQITVVDSTHLILQGSTYAANSWSGGNFYHATPFVKNVTCCFNYTHDCGNGFHLDSGGDMLSSDHVIKIYGNIFARMGRNGATPFAISLPHAAAVGGGSLVAANTMRDCGLAIWLYGGTNFAVKNNIAAGATTTFVNDYNGDGSNTYDYNDWQGAGSGTPFVFGGNGTTLQSWATWQAAGRDLHSIITDPLFINGGSSFALASDFQIPGNSPVRGAGVAITGITTDYAGNNYASPPSMGAWELLGYVLISDAGLGGDETIVGKTLSRAESASGVHRLLADKTLKATDTGAGLETIRLGKHLFVLDSAAGSDVLLRGKVIVLQDSGLGVDSIQVVASGADFILISESTLGSEQIFVGKVIALADTPSGADVVFRGKKVILADGGTGIDGFGRIPPPLFMPPPTPMPEPLAVKAKRYFRSLFKWFLLTEAQGYYGAISAADLEAAALQWLAQEEQKELTLPIQEYDG